ncbi:MAG: helix-turn-helix domain-containing protein [Stenotrophobium sp.]
MRSFARGHLGIPQIAYQLGYGDSANFTRAFRRMTGMAPSEYRQKLT